MTDLKPLRAVAKKYERAHREWVNTPEYSEGLRESFTIAAHEAARALVAFLKATRPTKVPKTKRRKTR